jgi:hypothetical protein
MPLIPVDVLREILDHVDKNDLATLCRVNKIFCSCSRDVLYREIEERDAHVIQTLAKSTDLARRVRSFGTKHAPPELATALQNMSSLRSLDFMCINDISILDGRTFKLDSFTCDCPHTELLQRFLYSQPSITHITLYKKCQPFPPFDERCLPNLTRVMAKPSWLSRLIPGRPVRSVTVLHSRHADNNDSSFFTLSTAPIQKLATPSDFLFPKHGSLLASLFPSLVHLTLVFYSRTDFVERQTVRRSLFCLLI